MSAALIESDTSAPGLPEPTWRSLDGKACADNALKGFSDDAVISIKAARRLLALAYDLGSDVATLRGIRP